MIRFKSYQVIEFLLIALSISLCIILAVYNRGSNDNHLEVSDILLKSLNLEKLDAEFFSCIECFQPKLYHFSVVAIECLLAAFQFDVKTLANLLNVVCWLITNLIITSVITEKFKGGSLRLSLLAFCWFNPSVMTVGVQASNDAFVMLFGSIALRFISMQRLHSTFYILASTLLAVFSKGTSLVILIVVFIRLIAETLINCFKKNLSLGLIISILLGSLVLSPLYLPNRLSPFSLFLSTSNGATQFDLYTQSKSWPPFYFISEECLTQEKPEYMCAIVDGIFTFRILSLIETPKVPRGPPPEFPAHMRSLWTTVYARYMLPVFPQHFWRDESPFMDHISSLLAILGLFPLIIFFYGCKKSLRFDFIKKQFWMDYVQGRAILHLVVVCGLLSMLALFNLSYKWTAAFKDIYLFCGLFSFWYLFLDGLQSLISSFKSFKFYATNILAIISVLWIIGLIKIIQTCV